MRPSTPRIPERLAEARPRFHDPQHRRWWREAVRNERDEATYWSRTRRPLPCLAFVVPILTLYELGVLWIGGGSANLYRTGADAWVRRGLAAVGMTDRWLPPLLLVIGLLAWQAADRREWRFPLNYLVGMALESLILAIGLVGLSKVVDLGFSHLEQGSILLAPEPSPRASPLATLLGFCGAGVYEEAIFRLALIPTLLGILRVLQMPKLLAGTIAVTGSALLFSIAHHVGVIDGGFTWFAFIFRWLAGVYFAWVFVVRGFGVAVGTHATYDILVGWLGWHL